jgi:hypothetical protein
MFNFKVHYYSGSTSVKWTAVVRDRGKVSSATGTFKAGSAGSYMDIVVLESIDETKLALQQAAKEKEVKKRLKEKENEDRKKAAERFPAVGKRLVVTAAAVTVFNEKASVGQTLAVHFTTLAVKGKLTAGAVQLLGGHDALQGGQAGHAMYDVVWRRAPKYTGPKKSSRKKANAKCASSASNPMVELTVKSVHRGHNGLVTLNDGSQFVNPSAGNVEVTYADAKASKGGQTWTFRNVVAGEDRQPRLQFAPQTELVVLDDDGDNYLVHKVERFFVDNKNADGTLTHTQLFKAFKERQAKDSSDTVKGPLEVYRPSSTLSGFQVTANKLIRLCLLLRALFRCQHHNTILITPITTLNHHHSSQKGKHIHENVLKVSKTS